MTLELHKVTTVIEIKARLNYYLEPLMTHGTEMSVLIFFHVLDNPAMPQIITAMQVELR